MNGFERVGRANKVLKLVRAIDAVCLTNGWSADEVRDALSNWTPEMWALVARGLCVNPPSKTTVEEVIAQYEDRQ